MQHKERWHIMNQEPISYLNNRLPVGITAEMVYKEIIKYIYHNILILGDDIDGVLDISKKAHRLNNLGLYDLGSPLTVGEATIYFIEQYR